MTGSVGDVVAQLLAVLRSLDAAAVTALRAQADADQAEAHFTEVARGTNHNHIRQAVTASHTASEKAARYARLLAKANESLTTYINKIAPGSTPTHQAAEAAAPSGERLAAEAESAGSRAETFLRRHVKKADDTEDALKQTEQAVTTGVKEMFGGFKGGPGTTGTPGSTTPSTNAPVERPQLEHPVTAVIMAAGAVVVGVRAMWKTGKRHRERKRHDDQP
ncbi:hypothetical protein [Plantactinospora sp. BB1]|uniref:hypothetical protein n=1 Tax=Plantactinospora sp. BB1 TaxID=2071627 RepID=UPI000D15BD8F|nr:hypothetical protein [Plantactinospora sp. BB1]AVT35753.1 hypothetical protein C6W10_03940 [Plantactinospora sp. BB1]